MLHRHGQGTGEGAQERAASGGLAFVGEIAMLRANFNTGRARAGLGRRDRGRM